MGQLANLTNTALADPNTGGVHWYGNAPAALGAWAQGQRNFQPPLTSVDDQGNKTPLGPDQSKPAPSLIKPTPQQAADPTGTGVPNAMSPGLTKAGKLMTLLTSGLQGALAGRAANEQATVASGGRRSGGAGMGFQAGYSLPWQRAMMPVQLGQAQTGLEAGQLQNQMTRAGLQPVQTPYGNMPIEFAAKSYLPWMLRSQAMQNVANTRAAASEYGADVGAGSRVKVAQIEQGQPIPLDPDVAHLAGFDELAGVPVGKGTLDNVNKALEARGFKTQDMGTNGTGPNQGMWLLDRGGNRVKQVSPFSLTFQRGASFAQNRPEEVVRDPNNPGIITYAPASEAMNKGLQAPQSAPTVAAKAITKSAVAGPIGNEINAFSTALQHADLLQNALTALGNGDEKTLNSLKNRFKTEFGSADVTNFQTIANAYSREITKMLAAGHMTNEEINTNGASLPANASPQQIIGALQAYKALAQSKLNIRQQQVQQGQKGKPNFPANNAPPPGAKVMSLTDFLNAR